MARPHALNGVTHLDARLAPVAGEVEHIEAVKLRLPLEQLRDGGGDVGQIGPGVADSRLTLVQNRADGLAGLDQALREPAVAGRRSEEVAGAHDERAHTVTAGGLEPISSSFHINNAPQVSLSSNRKWCLALSQDCSFPREIRMANARSRSARPHCGSRAISSGSASIHFTTWAPVNGIKIETSETLGFSICTSVQSLSLPGGRFAGDLRDGFVVEESPWVAGCELVQGHRS